MPRKRGDALGEVNDEVAFGQVEEGVDGARFELPARHDGADFFAVEEFVVAEHDDTGRLRLSIC